MGGLPSGRTTPAVAYHLLPKAEASGSSAGTHYRIRRDRIDRTGPCHCAEQGACTTSASAALTLAPPSSLSSRISTSASSTPRPESNSDTPSSTPCSATSPPKMTKDRTQVQVRSLPVGSRSRERPRGPTPSTRPRVPRRRHRRGRSNEHRYDDRSDHRGDNAELQDQRPAKRAAAPSHD